MLKKIKEYFLKHDIQFIIGIILLIVIGRNLHINLVPQDELWNFNNIYKMINGYKMYTEINFIIPPLFPVIGYIILKLFGTNIFIFRILNIIITTILIFLIYMLFRKLCKNKFRALFYFLIVSSRVIVVCAAGANYNTLAIALVLLGTYLNIKWIEKEEQHNILQAVIMFLISMTKHNIGMYYIIGIVIGQLITKRKIKDIIKQISILGTGVIIVALVLQKIGILKDFINLLILGIGSFAQENIGGNIINIIEVVMFMIIVMIVTTILLRIKVFKEEEKQKLKILISVSIPMLLIAFPIYNSYHKVMANMLVLISIIYILDILILKEFIKETKIIKIAIYIFVIFNIFCSAYYSLYWLKTITSEEYEYNYSHPYYGGIIEKEEKERIKNVTQYIQKSNKKVIVLTEEAAIYTIPYKITNGYMDLPLIGNLGKDGEEKIIEQLKQLENTQILIKTNQDELFWQESKKINQYVQKNLKKVGEIENLSIYEK